MDFCQFNAQCLKRMYFTLFTHSTHMLTNCFDLSIFVTLRLLFH